MQIIKSTVVKILKSGEIGKVKSVEGSSVVVVVQRTFDNGTSEITRNRNLKKVTKKTVSLKLSKSEIEIHTSISPKDRLAMKALCTLTNLGIDVDSLRIADMKKHIEVRPEIDNWLCNTCKGRGFITTYRREASGKGLKTLEVSRSRLAVTVQSLDGRHLDGHWEAAKGHELDVFCDIDCPAKCSLFNETRGGPKKVPAYGSTCIQQIKVTIGRPTWSKETVVKKPMHIDKNHSIQCELCKTPVSSDHVIAIEGERLKHTTIGLFVGSECARKLMGYTTKIQKLKSTEKFIIEITS